MGCNFFMDLSIDKLLAKMEAELHQARSSKEDNLREKIYSIKILCELILDEKVGSSKGLVSSRPQEVYQPAASMTIQQPMAVNQQKKLQTDDGANGDSLFDF